MRSKGRLPKNAIPIIDADWLAYSSCAAIEYGKDHPEATQFEDVVKVATNKISFLKKELRTRKAPLLCFNGKGNFRDGIAKQKKYKGVRPPKPYHYEHLVKVLKASEECFWRDGLEGDDMMAMLQTHFTRKRKRTVIVSVDKDLRQVPGWHYSPELWNAGAFGPSLTDAQGWIELVVKKNSKKVLGMGNLFLYSQCLTGDSVDNIPGLKGCGPAAAIKILDGCETEGDMFEAVRDAYREKSLLADECMLEQMNLVYMVRELEGDEPKLWQAPEVNE